MNPRLNVRAGRQAIHRPDPLDAERRKGVGEPARFGKRGRIHSDNAADVNANVEHNISGTENAVSQTRHLHSTRRTLPTTIPHIIAPVKAKTAATMNASEDA